MTWISPDQWKRLFLYLLFKDVLNCIQFDQIIGICVLEILGICTKVLSLILFPVIRFMMNLPYFSQHCSGTFSHLNLKFSKYIRHVLNFNVCIDVSVISHGINVNVIVDCIL